MKMSNSFIFPAFLIFILALPGIMCGQRVIDLDKVWGDMRVLGIDAQDQSGWAVAHGDINGDGYADIIIGASADDPGGSSVPGEVYVIFGSGNPPSSIDLTSQSADITVHGDAVGDECGYAVASGDVNNDGYDDIIIGAPHPATPVSFGTGETYVIFGFSPSSPVTIDLSTQSADITVCGDYYTDDLGWAVASGDVNGDGYDDIIIGNPLATPDIIPERFSAGETFIIFGFSPSSPVTIDLSTTPADITVCGAAAYDNSGWTVASGDINGDGFDDLIIGAIFASPGERLYAGETYVIFSSSTPPETVDLKTQADITVCGAAATDYSGYALASGDINGDGYDDVIIGAPWADSGGKGSAGETYVIFGSSFSSPPYTIDLSTDSADITVCGAASIDLSGCAVASGNVNGDKYDDIIIGALGADPGEPARYAAGETYVIFGDSFSSPPYTIDLSTTPADITVCGAATGDGSGWAVSSGDVNAEGYDDLIIGAPDADPGGRTEAGETYLIAGGGSFVTAHGLGGKSWIKSFSLLGRSWGGFKAFGELNSQGEVHLAIGDLDADGHHEIAAGHGEDGRSWVKLFEVDGSLIRAFKVFEAYNSGGEVHLAIGNFDADLNDTEIAAAHGEGGRSWVKLFEADSSFIRVFRAFGAANTQGEVHLAAADLDKNGVHEIIAGMGEGGSSWVKIFNRFGSLIRSFKAYGSINNPGGEVHVAVGNFDADPSVEIAVATGYDGSNLVKLFEKDGSFIRKFKAFGASVNPNGEVHIASGDIDNDGIDELICAHGEGGNSVVRVFKVDGTVLRSFKAFGGVNAQGQVNLGKSNY